MEKFERKDKYIVIKVEDWQQALSSKQKSDWINLVDIIRGFRHDLGKRDNSYVEVTEDQPYPEQVWKLIEEQWNKENGGLA